MSVETLQRLTIPNLKQLDILIQPNEGGRHEPNLDLNNTIVVAQPADRISSIKEPQKPKISPIELAPNLVMNPIPKWDMAGEINRFIQDINSGLEKGQTLEGSVSKSAQELEMNIRTYHHEITKSEAVLPHLNRFDLVDGTVRMVGHNGKPVVDSISARERKGSVLEASGKVENSLIVAKENSFAVLMSPSGWNGFTDQYGREVSPHLNTQTLVFWKDQEGTLKGLTFHTDLALDQAKNVMVDLGVSGEDLEGQTERDRIINMVKNPALLSLPGAYANPFEYVLDKILAKRGSAPFRLQQDGSVEIRSIEEVRTDIKRFDKLLKGSQEEEKLIAELRDFISAEAGRVNERLIQQQIVCKVEKTILRLAREYLQDTGQIAVYQVNTAAKLPGYSAIFSRNDDNFDREIAFLKTRGGCPPGTASMSLAGISLGTGGVGISASGGLESDSKGSLYFPCPACKTINKRPREGYVERCQNPSCPSPEAVRC